MEKRDIFCALAIAEIDAAVILLLSNNFLPQLAAFPAVETVVRYCWLILPLLALIGLYVAEFLSRYFKFFWQLAKFLLVGTSNVFVDLGVLGILQFAIGIAVGYWYSLFKATSALFAIANSYLWNKFWSFEQKDNSQAGKEALLFFAVAGSGIIVNNAIASYMVNVMGAKFGISPQGWGIVAGIVAAVIVFIWDFLGYKFFVFKK